MSYKSQQERRLVFSLSSNPLPSLGSHCHYLSDGKMVSANEFRPLVELSAPPVLARTWMVWKKQKFFRRILILILSTKAITIVTAHFQNVLNIYRNEIYNSQNSWKISILTPLYAWLAIAILYISRKTEPLVLLQTACDMSV